MGGLQKDNPETINIILAMQLKGSLVGVGDGNESYERRCEESSYRSS